MWRSPRCQEALRKPLSRETLVFEEEDTLGSLVDWEAAEDSHL